MGKWLSSSLFLKGESTLFCEPLGSPKEMSSLMRSAQKNAFTGCIPEYDSYGVPFIDTTTTSLPNTTVTPQSRSVSARTVFLSFIKVR